MGLDQMTNPQAAYAKNKHADPDRFGKQGVIHGYHQHDDAGQINLLPTEAKR